MFVVSLREWRGWFNMNIGHTFYSTVHCIYVLECISGVIKCIETMHYVLIMLYTVSTCLIIPLTITLCFTTFCQKWWFSKLKTSYLW